MEGSLLYFCRVTLFSSQVLSYDLKLSNNCSTFRSNHFSFSLGKRKTNTAACIVYTYITPVFPFAATSGVINQVRVCTNKKVLSKKLEFFTHLSLIFIQGRSSSVSRFVPLKKASGKCTIYVATNDVCNSYKLLS